MKIFIRDRGLTIWHDITSFVNLPIIIQDTGEGTLDTAEIELIVDNSFTLFKYDKIISPKLDVKITEAETEEEETENNTYYFIIKNSSKSRLRKANNENSALYLHKLVLEEMLAKTQDYNLPNYTITQPKTQYFDVFTRTAMKRYDMDFKFSHNGNKYNIPYGILRDENKVNTTNEIDINYDFNNSKYYVQLNNIATEKYKIDFSIFLRKTAATFMRGLLGNKITIGVGLDMRKFSLINAKTTTIYYDNLGNPITTTNIPYEIRYNGGEVDGVADEIRSMPEKYTRADVSIDVNENANASYCRVYFDFDNLGEEANARLINNAGYVLVKTAIDGFANDPRVKGQISSMQIFVQSVELTTAIEEKKFTLLQFIKKALHDYNLNRRAKITLSRELEVVLDVIAKESEWSGYDLYELLTRAFKYINAIPYLKPNGELTYIQPKNVAREIDFEETQEFESEIVGDDFFDTVVSNAKNLMSADDFVVERMLIGTTVDGYSQFKDDETGGFVTSNPIYFISNAKIYTGGNLEIKISDNNNSWTINSNIENEGVWDITPRMFEKDEYNALPDVRYETPSGTHYKSITDYGQGNTIAFTSGGNVIDRVFHRAPAVPEYTLFAVSNNVAEYAIIETLICLAYEYVRKNFVVTGELKHERVNIDFTNAVIQNMEMELTYCPIYKELTTKYRSNLKEREGLKWEKRLSPSDRVISYEDNEQVLKKEMERKGNEKKFVSMVYNTFNETIPTSSIINDNYIVTSKRLTITNNNVACEYTLQKNFMLQNEDVGLSVEYDRYLVPYEYVQREIMLENHLVFRNTKTNKYDGHPMGGTIQFVEDFIKTGNINGYLWAKLRNEYSDENLHYRDVLMKIAKLESNFTMILSGKFVDNYSAGLQRFTGYFNGEIQVSEPYRYTDYRGKIKRVSGVEIGYTPVGQAYAGQMRINALNGSTTIQYPINRFPEGNWENNSKVANLSRKYLNKQQDILLDKDAREGIVLNYHTFLESGEETIKWYSFKPVNVIGRLNTSVELTDDLTLDNIDYTLLEEVPSLTLTQEYNRIDLRVALGDYTRDYFENGIVFINKTGNSYTLCGISTKPNWVDNESLDVHIYTSAYGLDVNIGTNTEILNLNSNVSISSQIEHERNAFIWLKQTSLSGPFDYDLEIGEPLPMPNAPFLKLRRRLTNPTGRWVTITPPSGAPVRACTECPPINPAEFGTICACDGNVYEYQKRSDGTFEYYQSYSIE